MMNNRADYIKGMDISSYPEMLDKGYEYYDFNGEKVDLLDFAKKQGFNYGRLRIWNNPSRVPESGGYCDLEHTKWMAKEIVSREMGFMLDFHYSDWWADPGHQEMPEAWKTLSDEELVQAVYAFTKEVLEALDENGTYPDMIQIGNEIRCGMLWPVGRTDNWHMLAALINAGIRAVRDTQKDRDTQVMLHLDQGGRYYYYEEWFDTALANGVEDFDIIGLSYYPFWHGTFNDLKNTMEKLVARYHKPLILAETAHAYRRSSGSLFGEQQELNAGFPATPKAQRKVLELIMSIAAHVTDGMGRGIFYWEPFCRSEGDDGSWGSCMGVVDADGRPTEGLKAFRFQKEQVDCEAVAKVYAPEELTVSPEADLEQYLPQSVRVLKWDGRLEKQQAEWDDDWRQAWDRLVVKWLADGSGRKKENPLQEVAFLAHGRVMPCGEKLELRIKVESQNADYIRNGAFTEGLECWQLAASDKVKTDIRQEIAQEFPFNTENYFYFACEENFTLQLSQQVSGLEKGRYLFSLEYLGDNTTGVQVALYAKSLKAGERQAFPETQQEIFPTDMEWRRCELAVDVGEGEALEVGIRVDAPAIYGKIKKIMLKKAAER